MMIAGPMPPRHLPIITTADNNSTLEMATITADHLPQEAPRTATLALKEHIRIMHNRPALSQPWPRRLPASGPRSLAGIAGSERFVLF